jgi:5-oxoprolinase (ATP-hydrolysing) subunit C
MGKLTVVSHGIVTVQDAGRRLAQFGVPVSGPMDKVSFGYSLGLIQGAGQVAFEALSGAVKFQVDVDTLVAVTGPGEAYVAFEDRFDMFSAGTGFAVKAGSVVEVNRIGLAHGPVYVAVAGLTVPQVLGSASFDTFSGLGTAVTSGQIYEIDDTVAAQAAANPGAFLIAHQHRESHLVRYVPGPHLPADVLDRAWKVTSAARSGTRLRADSLTDLTGLTASLPSLPVIPGVIQVTPSGEAIILGPDSGVTGGYPVAGVVITADLHLVAHFPAGSTMRLIPVTAATADVANSEFIRQTSHAIMVPEMIGAW